MKNPRSGAGRLEGNHAAAHADRVLDEHELGSIVGGDIDYSTWGESALRKKVSELTLSTERNINSSKWHGLARDMSRRLYDMETELINRHIYGDYSQPALYWKQ